MTRLDELEKQVAEIQKEIEVLKNAELENNKNKPATETITEVIEHVCEDVCNNYCKYRNTKDENMPCHKIREKGSCPLNKLY